MASTKINHYDDSWYDEFEKYCAEPCTGIFAHLPADSAYIMDTIQHCVNVAIRQDQPLLAVYAPYPADQGAMSLAISTNHGGLNSPHIGAVLAPIMAADEEVAHFMIEFLSTQIPEMMSLAEEHIKRKRKLH